MSTATSWVSWRTALAGDIGKSLRRYVRYVFDTKSFIPSCAPDGVSAQALQAARLIRGAERGPAIFIHGIMPRSGTVCPVGHWQHWSWWKRYTFKRIAGQALMDLGYCESLDW